MVAKTTRIPTRAVKNIVKRREPVAASRIATYGCPVGLDNALATSPTLHIKVTMVTKPKT